MTPEQVAEGLEERYFDVRLLRDGEDPNMVIAGLAVFSWNDEWWKFEDGELYIQEDEPEEHFGIGKFEEKTGGDSYQLRYKLQEETVHTLYSLNFDNDANIIESVIVDNNPLSVDSNTWVYALISDSAAKPVRLRWECSRGYIIGDPNCVSDPNNFSEPNNVIFYAGKTALEPSTVTVVAIDTNGNVDMDSTTIDIETSEPNNIEILTLGTERASGRVYNVDMDKYKLMVYIEVENGMYVQPDTRITSIWIDKCGYWRTKVNNENNGDLISWLVPKEYEPNDFEEVGFSPSNAIAEANTVHMDVNDYNDRDNDLLPDYWELEYFDKVDDANDRYNDPDGDGANNLEEFLIDPNLAEPNMKPTDPYDNDLDNDDLWDNWERRFFGNVTFYDANDDPEGDGLTNSKELALGLHPVRVAADKDRDGLPDLWEIRWFNNLSQNDANNPDFDGCTNLDEYEVGLDPLVRDLAGDFDCQCDVDFYDLSVLCEQWLMTGATYYIADIAPAPAGDKIVNMLDFAVLAENWLE
jgi:hypothetical protein